MQFVYEVIVNILKFFFHSKYFKDFLKWNLENMLSFSKISKSLLN